MPTFRTKRRIRLGCPTPCDPTQAAADLLTNQPPATFRNDPLRFEIGLLDSDAATVVEDVAALDSVTVEIREEQDEDALVLATVTVAAASIEQALAQADWDDESDQHLVAELDSADLNLDLGDQPSAEFWLHIYGIPTDTAANRITIYSGPIRFHEPPVAPATGPISGGSIIPGGAAYDGSGNYTLSGLTVGRTYTWTDGSADISCVNGAETLVASGNFIAQATSVTLTGTPGAVITATVRSTVYLTAAEQDARYSRNLAIHRSSVAATETTGTTATTVATVTIPALGANDAIHFDAVLTRPTSPAQVENTYLNFYLDGTLIAQHLLGGGPVIVLPVQHLFSNQAATDLQLGGATVAGALIETTEETAVATTLTVKVHNQDASDACRLRALTIHRIRPAS